MAESRYEQCEVLRDGTREYLGVRLPAQIPSWPDDRFHTVLAGDRLDVLAHRYLGDARLWWAICDCNGLSDSLDLQAGMTIRIPRHECLA